MIKVFLISEALSAPFDEGIKKVAFEIHNQIEKKGDILSVTKEDNNTDGLKIIKICLNKFFLNIELRKYIKSYSPDVILYIPAASITFNSFIRAKILKIMNRLSKVVMLGIQRREYSPIQKNIIANFLKPDLLLLPGKSDKDFFLKMGLNVKVLPPAVDSIKFSPSTKEEKKKIRARYNILSDKKVVLHVGHIKVSRNIECLLELQKIENVQIVIIGSTTTKQDELLKERLKKNSVIVIDEFIEDIPEVYKMSDIYVFPVTSSRDAIDMPLSVLEAMACNLPVMTTRFGGLIDFLEEDTGFKYFDTTEKLVELIKDMDNVEVHNNKKVEQFTWERFTDEILAVCNESV